ncbi:hypothetical protein ACFE04_006142 [Oxalis oulophora]
MATSKSYFAKQNYRFLSTDLHHHHNYNHHDVVTDSFEFNESDIYNTNSVSTRSNSPEFRSSSRLSGGKTRSTASGNVKRSNLSASMPVNIPDWSKILGEEYRRNNGRDYDYEEEFDGGDDGEVLFNGGDDGVMIPPHEFLARTRIASFSVHEGVGRTLKGRDLSKVRNAIWEKTGFQD